MAGFVAARHRGPVVGRGPVALDAEVVLRPPGGLAHEELEAGVGRLEHEALGLELLEVVAELGGGAVVEVDAELLGLHHHAGAAAEVAHQHAGAVADRLRLDVLVGGAAGLAERGRVEARPCGRRRSGPRTGRPSAGAGSPAPPRGGSRR